MMLGVMLALAAFRAVAGESGIGAIHGRWVTPGIGALVELGPCGANAETLCGRIAWLWDGLDASGMPKTDMKNPDSARRDRSLIGAEMLAGFRYSAPGAWIGGSVYDPSDGHTYSGRIRPIGDGVIELDGCAFQIFCRRQIWRRPDFILQLATW